MIETEGVPPAPFSKTWHEFVLKRMVRWAAENGFDRIAWTTGEQQADRYNLARAVNRIEWEKTEPGEEKGIVTLSIAPRDVEPEELYREISQEQESPGIPTPMPGPCYMFPRTGSMRLSEKTWPGASLKILPTWDPSRARISRSAGRGMRGFYDKIIPEFLNKFGKKWGAKVEESDDRNGIMPGMRKRSAPDRIEETEPLGPFTPFPSPNP